MSKCRIKNKKNFEIVNISHPKVVHIKENFKVGFKIKNLNWLIPDNFKLYLYENDEVIYTYKGWVNAGDTVEFNPEFSISESGRFKFHLSLMNDRILDDTCEDYVEFSIICLEEGGSKTLSEIKEILDENGVYIAVGVAGLVILFAVK